MPTPFARTCSTLAAVAVSVFVTAAPTRAQGTTPATPQAALDALEAANAKGDARAALALITPDGQKRLARDTVMNGLMMLAFMDPDDPSPMGPKPTGADLAKRREAFKAVKTSITAALKPSGLDAAIGQPLMPAEKIVDAKMGAVDPGALVPTIMDAVVKAAPAFGMKGTPPMMKLQPFTNLKVDGDHATVKSGPRTMKIDKVGGKWLIDAPLPELQEPPQ
jgi:hypothetical protein